ncbi:MAG: helix-turn-helix transcriptional regulator [Bacteroidetes bacterium]|nr:helix-turn-helix transcriptional regulator [Bacteroidota bacterium]
MAKSATKSSSKAKKLNLSFSSEQLNIAIGILRALDHPMRLSILEFLNSRKLASVNEIMIEIRQEQSKTSQMLKILKDEALVLSNRNGKFIQYSINHEKLAQIQFALKA